MVVNTTPTCFGSCPTTMGNFGPLSTDIVGRARQWFAAGHPASLGGGGVGLGRQSRVGVGRGVGLGGVVGRGVAVGAGVGVVCPPPPFPPEPSSMSGNVMLTSHPGMAHWVERMTHRLLPYW